MSAEVLDSNSHDAGRDPAMGAVEWAEARQELVRRCRLERARPSDELGLAALFESWGVTDSIASTDYGCDDVFDLAQMVDGMLWGAPVESVPDPETVPLLTVEWVVRGCTYFPPVVFMVVSLLRAPTTASVAWFGLLACVGWGASEGYARVAYTAVNRAGPGAVRRFGTRLALFGPPIALAVGAASAVVCSSAVLGVLVTAQSTYLVAAMLLLPLDRERALLATVAPGLLATALCVWAPGALVPALVLTLLGLVVSLVRGVQYLRGFEVVTAAEPTSADLVRALPFVAAGALMGLSILALAILTLRGAVRPSVAVSLILPLMVSMGFAEIGIRRFHLLVLRDMETSTSLEMFSRRARTAVVVSTGSYMVIGAGLSLAAAKWRGVGADSLLEVRLLMWLLGIALFLTLILTVTDHIAPVLFAFGGANVVCLALLFVRHVSDAVVPSWLPVLVAAAMVVTLAVSAIAAAGEPAAHGFG